MATYDIGMTNQELADALRNAQANIPELKDIARICVERCASDANAAMQDGAVLLGISTVCDDEDGDGFRILLGLRRGTTITPYLSQSFGGPYDQPA